MINKIKKTIEQQKTLIANFSYLAILNVFNMLLPLITYPYLIRVLGKETYGLVVFAQAVVGYFVVLVSFGFNFSATKEISIYRDDKDKISEIVSSVFIIKGALFFLALIFLSIVLLILPQAKGYELLFSLTMWLCLYDFIFPVWYFQGIEQMKYITYITLISRLTFLSLIFLIIHAPSDYLFLPIINGVGAVLAGITALYILFNKHQVKFKMQSISTLKYYFFESITIFISNLSTTLYLTTNKVILGIFLGMKEVAYYDLAEKLSMALKTPIQLIGQTIYPKVANEKKISFLKTSFIFTFSFSLVILISGFLASNYIIILIGGKGMLESSAIFQILLISIVPITISLFYGNIVLLTFGHNKLYLRLRVLANAFYFISIFGLYLGGLINLYSLSILAVLIEIFAAYLSVRYAVKCKINFLKLKFN